MTRQRGVALVEFALILPFLLVMLVMTAELGRAIYHYGELAKSVREAEWVVFKLRWKRLTGQDLPLD